eukprot:5892873-Karenia_brevis.AAC.1
MTARARFSASLRKGETPGREPCRWGFLWNKEEFLSEAIGVIHPFDRQIKLPPRVANVLHDMARLPPSAT